MSDRSHRRHDLTRAEIKAAARAHLVGSGPAGISLRAIARDMGITAPALYRYYPALDSLILQLCTDLHIGLRLPREAHRPLPPGGDPAARPTAHARGFPHWGLARLPEGALMFRPPLPRL